MKQPKKLTRNQKEILVKKGMNPDDYMLHSEDEKEMILYNKPEHPRRSQSYWTPPDDDRECPPPSADDPYDPSGLDRTVD